MENEMSQALVQILKNNAIPYKEEQISQVESNARDLKPSLAYNLNKIVNAIESFNQGKFQKSKKLIEDLVSQCEKQQSTSLIQLDQLSLMNPQQIEINIDLLQQNISSQENMKQTIDSQLTEAKDILQIQMGELIAYPMQMQEYINTTGNSNYQRVINLSTDQNRQFLIGIAYLMRDQQFNRSLNFSQVIQWQDVQTLFRQHRIKEAMRDYDILLLKEDSASMARQCYISFEQDNLLSPFWEWFQICLQYFEQVCQFAPLRDRVQDLQLQANQIKNDFQEKVKQKNDLEQLVKEHNNNKEQYEALITQLVQHNYYCWQQFLLNEQQKINIMLQYTTQISFTYAVQKIFSHLNVKDSTIIQQSLNKMIGSPRTYVTDYPFLQTKFYLLQQQQISFIYDEQNLIELFIEYLERKQKKVEKKSYSESLKQLNLDYLVVTFEEIGQIKPFKQLNAINQNIHYLILIPISQLRQYQQLYNNDFVNLNTDLDNFYEYQKLYFGQTSYSQYNLFTEEELYQFIDKLKYSSFGSLEEMHQDFMTNPLFKFQEQKNDCLSDYSLEKLSLFKKVENKLYNIQQQKHLYHILKSIDIQNQFTIQAFIEQIINCFLQHSSNCSLLPDLMEDDQILEIFSNDMMEPPFLMQSDCESYLKFYCKLCSLCHKQSINLINFSNFIKNETTRIFRQQKESAKILELLKGYQQQNRDLTEDMAKMILFEELQSLQQLVDELEIANQQQEENNDILSRYKTILDGIEKKEKPAQPKRIQINPKKQLNTQLCFQLANVKNMSLQMYQALQMLLYLLNFDEPTCVVIHSYLVKVNIIKKLNNLRLADIDLKYIQKYKEQRKRQGQMPKNNYLLSHLYHYFNQIDQHIQQAEEYISHKQELEIIEYKIENQIEQIECLELSQILVLEEKIDLQKRKVIKSIYQTKVSENYDTSNIKIIKQEIQRIELNEKFIEQFQKELIMLRYFKSENNFVNYQILFFVLKQFSKNQNLLSLIQNNNPLTINKIIKKINYKLISNVTKNRNLRKLYIYSLVKEIIQKYIRL